MTLSRRAFLRAGMASAATLAPGALEALCARLAEGATLRARGHGPLVRDPEGLLDLPDGFQYRALSTARLGPDTDARFSQRLDGGELVPALHDGMAAFPGPEGVTILVRNHELEPGHTPVVDPQATRRYDRLGTGGTTTLWVDAERKLVRSFASLAGTFRNCAGGPTPWGSWLSAEECTYLPGAPDPEVHDLRPDVSERHGYVFEVDARAEGLVDPAPIRALGRFQHEAIAVDPATGFVYMTEDRADGLLYRFRPEVVTSGSKQASEIALGDLARGGVLEALRIHSRPRALTQNWGPSQTFRPGRHWTVDWVAFPQTDPDVDMQRDQDDTEQDTLQRRAVTAPTSTRAQGHALGAAQFARGEGITWHDGVIWFCATIGGAARAGQVWRLEPARNRVALLLEPDDRGLLDGPDNIVVAPNGDLVVCEDGRRDDFVLGITRRGRIYPIARNAYGSSEFAGACFSADGATMFVNVQEPGITFAIWGPWESRQE